MHKTYQEIPLFNKPLSYKHLTGFQPTYEELKPGVRVHRVKKVHYSFQPTYEELKLAYQFTVKPASGSVFSLPMRNWNKKEYKGQIFTLVVFSLPMRNWNRYRYLSTIFVNWFSAYLWGIETLTGHDDSYPTPTFSAYLWGIETLQALPGKDE